MNYMAPSTGVTYTIGTLRAWHVADVGVHYGDYVQYVNKHFNGDANAAFAAWLDVEVTAGALVSTDPVAVYRTRGYDVAEGEDISGIGRQHFDSFSDLIEAVDPDLWERMGADMSESDDALTNAIIEGYLAFWEGGKVYAIGDTATFTTWEGDTLTGTIERWEYGTHGRAIIRFANGTWAYGSMSAPIEGDAL